MINDVSSRCVLISLICSNYSCKSQSCLVVMPRKMDMFTRMFLWHILFGAPLQLPHRMYDPSLPLFLKTRNIRTAYMDA